MDGGFVGRVVGADCGDGLCGEGGIFFTVLAADIFDGHAQEGGIEKAQFFEADSALHIKNRQGANAVAFLDFGDDLRCERRGAHGKGSCEVGCEGFDFFEAHDETCADPTAKDDDVVG